MGCALQGYACDFVEVAGETRSNITVIDEATGITTKLNEPGPTVTERDLCAMEQLLLKHIVMGDICVFSGSLPPGAPAQAYARLITTVHCRGARAILDTSGPALALGCATRPAFIKPNADRGHGPGQQALWQSAGMGRGRPGYPGFGATAGTALPG